MEFNKIRSWRPDSHNGVSGEPGAVQTGSKSWQRGLAVRTDSEDRQARSMTRIKSFLSFWATFPGVLTGGAVLLIGITVFVVLSSR